MQHNPSPIEFDLQELEKVLETPPGEREMVRRSVLRHIEALDLDDDRQASWAHTQHQSTDQEDDMAARLTNLENHVGQLRVDVAEVKTKVSNIESNMLTKGKAATLTLGLVLGALATVVGGVIWVVQQYLAPILQAAGAS